MNHHSQNKTRKLLIAHHREATIALTALLIVFVRFLFPAKLAGELFWVNILLFLVFPLLIVRLLLKEKLQLFGIRTGDFKKGLIFSIIFALVFVFINYLIVFKTNFRNQLQIYPPSLSNFWFFLWFQLIISLPLHFSWEFFFRGFLQMGLEQKIGKYAVFLQAFLQTALYAKSPLIIIFLIGSSSLFAGLIARQSRSIFYSFVAMWLVSISLDIMVIRYIRLSIA